MLSSIDLQSLELTEMTRKMDAIANKCIQELEETAKEYGLQIGVEIYLTDIKT